MFRADRFMGGQAGLLGTDLRGAGARVVLGVDLGAFRGRFWGRVFVLKFLDVVGYHYRLIMYAF